MTIIQATAEHIEDLVPLLDGYRVFYRQPSNIRDVRAFLKERPTKQDSVIYIDDIAVGFYTTLFFVFFSKYDTHVFAK